MSRRDPPNVVEQVEALVARVRRESPQLGHAFEARSALAVSLARTLETAEDKYVAALTKELRALIAELADGIPRAGDKTPFGSDLPDPRPGPAAEVPAPVRNPAKSRPRNDRAGRGKGDGAPRDAADAMAKAGRRRAGGARP